MNADQVEFHREGQFFSIGTSQLSLRFSTSPPGTLVSLGSKALGVEALIPHQAVAAGDSWRLWLPRALGPSPIVSRRAQNFDYDFAREADGSGILKMTWGDFADSGGAVPIQLALTILLPPASPLCSCRVSLQIPGDIDAAGAVLGLPHLSALRFAAPEKAALFVPLGQGILVHNPASNISAESEWLYPGELSMQFAGLRYLSPNASLYLATYDSENTIKGLRAGPDEEGRFALSLLHFPTADANGHFSLAYDVILGVVPGDWADAAYLYRNWALRQEWAQKPAAPKPKEKIPQQGQPTIDTPPERYRGIWMIGHGEKREVIPAARALQRQANTAVRLLWRWWHGCPGRSLYPDYFPPRDTEEEFARALAQLSEAGILCWPGLDGASASPRAAAWEPRALREHAALNLAGGTQETEINPFCAEALVAMCAADGKWAGLMQETRDRLTGLGATGAWFERTLPQGAGLRCFAAGHPHPKGAGRYPLAAIDILGEGAIASDPTEALWARLEAALFTGVSAERMGRPRGLRNDDWEPVALFAAVYMPELRAIGLLGPLDNSFPRDPMWEESAERPRASEMALLREDYTRQFMLEAARGLLWGCQPAIGALNPDVFNKAEALRKLAFLHATMQVDALEPAGVRGEFAGPVDVESREVEVDFLVNSTFHAAGTRRVFARTMRGVLATAWKGERGKNLLIVVNLRERESEFTCILSRTRLGGLASGKINALTFSPELRGQTARLSLSDEEVSGVLPARSASLIWL